MVDDIPTDSEEDEVRKLSCAINRKGPAKSVDSKMGSNAKSSTSTTFKLLPNTKGTLSLGLYYSV